jgi:tRNA(fMet)-specific endonuclease VapC
MYFFDTDTTTHLHQGHRKVIDRLKEVGDENVATTIVTAIEILRGRHEFILKAADGADLLRAQQRLDESEALLLDIRIFPINSAAAAEFDKLRQVKKLKKIGRADLLIGCIALAHRAILVTRNVKDFQQLPGLRVENWVD